MTQHVVIWVKIFKTEKTIEIHLSYEVKYKVRKMAKSLISLIHLKCDLSAHYAVCYVPLK